MSVTVITSNTPPTFLTTPIAQSTPAGVPIIYTLPSYLDNEGDSCTIGLTSGPSFVSFTAPNMLNINPSLNEVGTSSASVFLTDG